MKRSSFLKPMWSQTTGFSVTLQLSFSQMVSEVHFNWEINMPGFISVFIVVETITRHSQLTNVLMEHRMVVCHLSHKDFHADLNA